jgi:hypothetical protein
MRQGNGRVIIRSDEMTKFLGVLAGAREDREFFAKV